MVNQKSILDNIGEKYGEEVKKDILEISYSSNIYILYIADGYPVTEKSLKAEFASWQVKWPDRTWEQFLKFKRNWKEDKYKFIVEPQGYFLDEETAIDYAKSNMGDINEAGAYPYAIVASAPLSRVYPTCNECSYKLFLYNRETDSYEPIDWNYSEETKYLCKEVDVCYKFVVDLKTED